MYPILGLLDNLPVGAGSHPGRRTCRWGPNPFIPNLVTAYEGRSPSYFMNLLHRILQLPLGAESHSSIHPFFACIGYSKPLFCSFRHVFTLFTTFSLPSPYFQSFSSCFYSFHHVSFPCYPSFCPLTTRYPLALPLTLRTLSLSGTHSLHLYSASTFFTHTQSVYPYSSSL